MARCPPPLAGLAALALLALLAGCGAAEDSLGGAEAAPPAAGEAEEAGGLPEGVLGTVALEAPGGSPAQFLARLAAEFGWEEQVAQNAPLQRAVRERRYEDKVVPFLLALYYRNGFSVLPKVGEGHQFNRDTVVRGAVASSRLLVTTREPVRIIFIEPVQNVQIVHHQDATPPRVFSISDESVVSVRESLLKWYLR